MRFQAFRLGAALKITEILSRRGREGRGGIEGERAGVTGRVEGQDWRAG